MRVSVGITVHAEPARLQATLAAVQQNARRPYEVLILGDGPEQDVVVALAQLGHFRQSSTQVPAGAPACFNRLAAQTDADVVILLESGSVPAPGALDLLVDVILRDRRVGLAGPSTNFAWNEQCAFPDSGAGAIVETAREAARRYGSATRTLEPLHSLADFCLAVRREVIDAVGGADEGYGLGPCWELEYNLRAARAGFCGLWVCAAYVWRAQFTARRRTEEARLFNASRRRYQDSVCGLRLAGLRGDYQPHCRGEECEHFAPPHLIRLKRSLVWRPSEPASPVPASRVRVSESPLVSCVMPTRGRPEFVRQAVRLFERQDYPNRELLIAGDPDDQLEAVVPPSERIRHIRCPPGESIGAKRNRACDAAAGAYIAQWDDDDWYGPGRLSAQLAPLAAGRADICGLRSWIFFDLPRWQFWTVTPALHSRLFVGDVHGGTLTFTKSVWQRLSRYPNASLAEDAAFLVQAQAHGARLERVDGTGLFVYLRHARNAWSFECGVHVDRVGWRRAGEPDLPAEDRAFYLAQAGAPHGGSRDFLDPKVSCLMPTHNRRHWIARSISYFLRQDYPSRELVIIDDGDDRVADLIPADPRIRYVALETRLLLGEKRNYGCDLARGEIIAHWDDDDWQAPHRLRYQVEELERYGAGLCGPGRIIFFDPAAPRSWQYEYPQSARGWVAGSAMCYRKELWSENRFANVQVGEDTRFVWSPRAGTPLVLPDHRFCVALIHESNTSPKVTSGSYWRAHPLDDVRGLLGDDYPWYLEQAQASPKA